MDLLNALRLGQISEDDADRMRAAAIDAFHEHRSRQEWWQHLGLSRKELAAQNWGASWHDLATLRYRGWPSACAVCGLPLDWRADDWAFTHTSDGAPRLAHIACPTERRFAKHMEDWHGLAVTGDFNHDPFWTELVHAVMSSRLRFPWRLGDHPTIACLASMEGHWLAVQSFDGGVREGQFAAAYPPSQVELQAMLRVARSDQVEGRQTRIARIRPSPPNLALSFYFGDQPEDVQLLRLVEALADQGATIGGEARLLREDGIPAGPFSSRYGYDADLIEVASLADLFRYVENPDRRLVAVPMRGAAGIVGSVPDEVGYVGITNNAAFPRNGPLPSWQTRHPLAIETDGALFCAPVRQQHVEEARARGRRVFERFLGIVDTLDPWYATIAIEWDLECPYDLMFDSRSFAFVNAYVSRSYFGGAVIARLREVYAEAHQQDTRHGAYFSCMADFNPRGSSLDGIAMQNVAVAAGGVLADALREHDMTAGRGND